MAGRVRWAARIVAVALATGGVSVRVESVEAREPLPGSGAPAFAGASACARCHGAIEAAWARGNHARSTVEGRGDELPAEARASAIVSHAPGVSTFHATGDLAVVETIGPDGKPATYPVSYVVGRRRLRMYVTALPSGPLQVLPFMREEGTGNWFDYTHLIFGAPDLPPDRPPTVAPGDPSFWTGPVRSFDASCARCHTSGREPVAPAPDGTGPRSTWRALGVDCEACHGASASHVALWSSPPRGDVHDPVAKLGAFDRDASLSLCLSCHLEGEVVKDPFRPGDDVLEHLDPTLLDDAERVDPAGRPLELVYEGLSFLASRCAEAGNLTCLSCHAAHGSAHGALLERAATDDGLCAACHARIAAAPARHAHHAGGGSGARCISCHMPKVTVERGHGAVTDHTIGIPSPGSSAGVRTALDACTGCHAGARGFPPGAPALGASRISAAFDAWWPRATRRPAWSKVIASARERSVEALRGLEILARDTSVPRVVRASAAALLGRAEGVDPATLLEGVRNADSLVRRAFVGALAAVRSEEADAALLGALTDPSPAVRVRAARAALAGFERAERNLPLARAAIPVLEANAAAAPTEDLRWYRLAAARQIVGDLAGAVAAYERQCALDPFAAVSRATMARLRERLRRTAK